MKQNVLFVPPGLKKFKLDLFMRIAGKCERAIYGDFDALAKLGPDEVPIVGCTPELRGIIDERTAKGWDWIYWDRGYCRRVFATWLPRGSDGGYYRWHRNSFQMQSIRAVASDRWQSLEQPLHPWRMNGKHVLVLEPTPTYCRFHKLEEPHEWTRKTIAEIHRYSDRPIISRTKESKVPLHVHCQDAHCVVAHGSNAAVEAVILGVPAFVDKCSAAALVGLTDLSKIEYPVTPDRAAWAASLAYSQFNEAELVDGTLWRLMR